jgi:hypothetical protein
LFQARRFVVFDLITKEAHLISSGAEHRFIITLKSPIAISPPITTHTCCHQAAFRQLQVL